MAPHSSTLAWKIPWLEEPGRLQSMGSRRVRHGRVTSLHSLHSRLTLLEREMATHSMPGESHGQRSLAGHALWGRRESDTTEVSEQQQRGPFPFSLFLFISEQKVESVGRMYAHQEVK